MVEKSPNLVKDINFHIQEDQHTPGRINTWKTTPRHIKVFKPLVAKNKEKLLKETRGKQSTAHW